VGELAKESERRGTLHAGGSIRGGVRFLCAVRGRVHVVFEVAVVGYDGLTIGNDGWNEDDCNPGKTKKKIRPHGKTPSTI